MSVSISHVHVIVDDPDDALAFYRDTPRPDRRQRGRRTRGCAGSRFSGQPARDPDRALAAAAGRSQEDGDALAALLAKGALGTVQFRTDDLDATFERSPRAARGLRRGRSRRVRRGCATPRQPLAARGACAALRRRRPRPRRSRLRRAAGLAPRRASARASAPRPRRPRLAALRRGARLGAGAVGAARSASRPRAPASAPRPRRLASVVDRRPSSRRPPSTAAPRPVARPSCGGGAWTCRCPSGSCAAARGPARRACATSACARR